MTDCEAMRDRIPEVAAGGPAWTPDEQAHLGACTDCQAEWALVQAARRIAETDARRVDPARIAATTLGQIRAERRRQRLTRGGWLTGLAAAAAIALVLWGRPAREDAGEPGTVAAVQEPLRVPLAELERLDASQLEAVLEGLEEPLGSGAAPDAPHLGDLDDHQLERVLRSLEG